MTERVSISEAELRRRLDDEESASETLAELFEPELFSARLVPREHVEIVPKEAIVDKSLKGKVTGAAIDLANSVCAGLRQRRYRRVIKERPELLRAVAEGDSWFLHPQIPDIVDQLFGKENPRMAILSLAAAGDTLAYMWRHNQYLAAVEKEDPKFVLLSGGGNDILGREFPGYLNNYSQHAPGQNVQRFLNANFGRKLRHLHDIYGSIVRDLGNIKPTTKVVVHGYDYVRAGVEKPDPAKHEHKGTWLGKHLSAFGIEDEQDRDGIVRFIIDSFNDEVLKPLTEANENLVYVDVRDTVGSHEWYDEIHPNDSGFNAVAIRIYAALTDSS